ncbi:MAG TPA: ABC transporter substrate-binding protein [Clostridiaceae bacterium]|nr:ABC transporter substrate-binding protein [Clostridiaceae bacterium]
MRMKKIVALFLALTLVLTLFAGCGQKSENTGKTTDTQKSDTSSSTSSKSEEKTLVYGLAGDIDDFDPFSNQTLRFIKTLGYNCYESLLHINENMQYEMDLAESYEHPDDLTYIFKLRKGVKFHNGNTMTAEDVKFSIERAIDPNVGSWLGAYFTQVKSVEIVDENTVKINLSEVSPAFLDGVCMLKIINKGTEGALKQKPIGTGPFKFISWAPNDNITLEKFADYWDASKVKIEKLILKPIPDQTVAMTNLEAGSINLYEDLSIANAIAAGAKDNIKVLTSKTSNSTALFEVGLHNVPAFSDPKVMAAICHALDKETINKEVYNNMAKVIWSPFPSGAKYFVNLEGNTFDLEKAKALLNETQYKDGFEFKLTVMAGDTMGEQIAVIWQAALAQIGVNLKINIVEFSVWLEEYLDRSYDMILNQYPMAGTDPSTYCNQIIYPLLSYQAANIPGLGDFINQGKTESNDAKRAEIYKKIQELIFEYKPVISIVEAPLVYGATVNLKGVEINPVGHTFLKNATLE